MLKNISWNDYLLTVGISLIVYYFYVCARYYSKEIKDLLLGKKKLKFKTVFYKNKKREYPGASNDQKGIAGIENTTDGEFDETERLIEQLKTAIADGSCRKLIPEEFKLSLIMILKQYPALKYSPLRPSINELILSECEKFQITAIDEREIELLWREGV